MKCSCGKALLPGAKFCSECGAKVEALPTTPAIVRQYPVKKVSINTVFAHVVFNEVVGDQTTIEIDGDEEMKQALAIGVDEDAVIIRGELPGVTIRMNPFSVQKRNGEIWVNGVYMDPARRLEIKISVPAGSSIWINRYTVGDMVFSGVFTGAMIDNSSVCLVRGKTFNNLNLTLSSSGGFYAERVTEYLELDASASGDADMEEVMADAKVYLSGSGDLTMSVFNGSLSASLSGSGNVSIDDGKVELLSARLSGSGDLSVDGTVVKAVLILSGSGDVEIDTCVNKPEKDVSGSGDVDIENKLWKKVL
ncbi:MAG TPA: DUF2807 domain-containing protein [Patescibacteria group bacterium]